MLLTEKVSIAKVKLKHENQTGTWWLSDTILITWLYFSFNGRCFINDKGLQTNLPDTPVLSCGIATNILFILCKHLKISHNYTKI